MALTVQKPGVPRTDHNRVILHFVSIPHPIPLLSFSLFFYGALLPSVLSCFVYPLYLKLYTHIKLAKIKDVV